MYLELSLGEIRLLIPILPALLLLTESCHTKALKYALSPRFVAGDSTAFSCFKRAHLPAVLSILTNEGLLGGSQQENRAVTERQRSLCALPSPRCRLRLVVELLCVPGRGAGCPPAVLPQLPQLPVPNVSEQFPVPTPPP